MLVLFLRRGESLLLSEVTLLVAQGCPRAVLGYWGQTCPDGMLVMTSCSESRHFQRPMELAPDTTRGTGIGLPIRPGVVPGGSIWQSHGVSGYTWGGLS